jgi:hypothetical protein
VRAGHGEAVVRHLGLKQLSHAFPMISHDTIRVTKLGYLQSHLGFGDLCAWSCSLAVRSSGHVRGHTRYRVLKADISVSPRSISNYPSDFCRRFLDDTVPGMNLNEGLDAFYCFSAFKGDFKRVKSYLLAQCLGHRTLHVEIDNNE